MNEITDKIKIATFGCWNRGCVDLSGQQIVSNVLKQNEKLYNFMVILGDNYYPTKTKLNEKYKVANIQSIVMKKGFDCIENINLTKKLLMGNHDVVDSIEQGCSVMKYQLKMPWYDVKYPFGCEYHYMKTSNSYETVLIFYLDTNIYENGQQIDCYKETIGINDIETLKEQQHNFINDKLSMINPIYNVKQIIMFGHAPLFTAKYKISENKKSESLKQTVNNELIDLIFENMLKYDDLKFTWICADFHTYQHSSISLTDKIMNLTGSTNSTNQITTNLTGPTGSTDPTNLTNKKEITQLIFGTGGAELDYVTDNSNTIYLDDHYKLTIKENKVYDKDHQQMLSTDVYNLDKLQGFSAYGYGEIEIQMNGHIDHKFIFCKHNEKNTNANSTVNLTDDATSQSQIGSGYKKKYIDMKRKYIKFKYHSMNNLDMSNEY